MQGNLFDGLFCHIDFQDEGHTGKIHDAETVNDKHYGMFIFDFGPDPVSCISYKFVLNVESYTRTVPFGRPLFDIIPGRFNDPSEFNYTPIFDDESLVRCGWDPIKIQSGKYGSVKEIKHTVFADDISKIILELVFPFNERYLGFLIDPYVTDEYDLDYHFEIGFYRLGSPDALAPFLMYQKDTIELLLDDSLASKERTQSEFLPERFVNHEIGNVEELMQYTAKYFKKDFGVFSDEVQPRIKLKSADYAVNYSMVITHIKLSEKGYITEVYGFNGYTDRYYYPDTAFSFEQVSIKKYNIVTWSGLLVEWPWATMLWYGEVIYFADIDEFGECCRQYFKEHSEDACPVCGDSLGGQLKYSFIDVTRIPHQIYFCSKKCLNRFNSNMMKYLSMMKFEDNTNYITSIDI